MPSGRTIIIPVQSIGCVNSGHGRSQVNMTLELEVLRVTNCMDNFPIHVWLVDGTYLCSCL